MGEDGPVTRDRSADSAADTDGHRPGEGPQGISVQGTAIVGIGLVVAQVVAMLQMLVLARLLGPEQYGVFGAMAVVLLIGSTVMAATQVTVARHIASGRSMHRIGSGAVLAAGAAATLLGAALAPLLSRLLNLPDVLGLLLVAVTFLPFSVTGAQLGMLQGREQHGRLAVLYVVSTVARVAGAIIGGVLGGTADSAMLGLMLGASVGAAAGQLVVRDTPPWRSEEGTREYLVEVGHAGHALLVLYALTNIDVLIARAQLSAYDAGLYAAGALVARAVFFLPTAVLVAAFPRMVAGARHAQRQALGAVAGLGLLATIGVALLPTLTITIMAGEQYLAVTDEAWLFALEGAGFGVVQVLLYARMAHHDRRAAVLLWSAVVVLGVLGMTLGTSIAALVTCAVVVAWVTALVGVVWARRDPVRADSADVAGPAV
jgi:O-antigen/teichoic acid export membrane protein